MSALAPPIGLTAAELAERLSRLGRLAHPERLEPLLADCERLKLVERAADGWRLSPAAERRFGSALRGPLLDGEERRAT